MINAEMFGNRFSKEERRALFFSSIRIGRSLENFHRDPWALRRTSRACSFFSALGMHSVVYSYLEDLVREGMAPREGQIITWARAALNSCGKDRGYKFGAQILLVSGCWESKLLSLQEIGGWTLDAACENGDHGITRLFAILMRRFKQEHTHMTLRGARFLATVIARTFISRDGSDREFLPPLFFSMIRESFSANEARCVEILTKKEIYTFLVVDEERNKEILKDIFARLTS